MNYKNYAKRFKVIFKRFGVMLSILLAFLGVYSLTFSRFILDNTIFKVYFASDRVKEGFVRILSTFIVIAVIYLLGLARKFRLNKDHKFLLGLLYSYPLVALGISVFYVCNVSNICIGNTLVLIRIVRLTFYMISVGLFEELLFRGVIQNILLIKFRKCNWIYAVFLQAIIFGIAHIGNQIDPVEKYIQCVFSCFAGFFFGYTYYKTKSLIPSMVVHAFYDFGLCFYGCFTFSKTVEFIDTGLNWWSVLLAALLSLMLCLLKIRILQKKTTYTLEQVELELGIKTIKETWYKAAQAALFIDKCMYPL